jgi:hypothetical protein
MAKSKPPRDNKRKGSVRGRSQIKNPLTGTWTKRGDRSGKFMDIKADAKPFKGVPKSSSVAREFMMVRKYLSSDGLVDVDKVAAEFNFTKASLAQSLGFAEETLQRFSRVSAQKTQQRLREMLEILTRVEPWAGGMPQAMGWYRGQGIPALGDQTAEALVKNDQAAIVRAYLDGLATGAFA